MRFLNVSAILAPMTEQMTVAEARARLAELLPESHPRFMHLMAQMSAAPDSMRYEALADAEKLAVTIPPR